MDKALLVDEDIRDGERLIRALDSSEYRLRAALWFFFTDSSEWRLLLASPIVDEKGPKEAYVRVQSVLMGLRPRVGISLKHIGVLSPNSYLIALLKQAIRTEPTSISRIRFSQNTINNVFVDDALIYRIS